MELRRIVFVVLFLGCKSKAPAPVIATATSVSASAPVVASAIVVTSPEAAPRAATKARAYSVDAIVVSSRVDNATESPEHLVDGDPTTAWSSRTGDLVGAWVALRLTNRGDVIHEVALTVGMTKNADLFQKNVRIAEVQVSFNDVVVRDHFRLDTESLALQSIPFTATAPGVVKITVQSIKAGTRADWREITISEIELRDEDGALRIGSPAYLVGSFDPKPRGVLGIVPEKRVPLGCLAALPAVPRVYCALGQAGNHWQSASLVSIDKDGMKTIAPLMTATGYEPHIAYGDWLRVERELRSGVTLDAKSAKTIPWGGALEVESTTFRQRTTVDNGTDEHNAVLEMRAPGATPFTKLFDEVAPIPSAAMDATVLPIGSMWLVERSASHGSEGWFMNESDATLCDLHAHTCTAFVVPASPPSAE